MATYFRGRNPIYVTSRRSSCIRGVHADVMDLDLRQIAELQWMELTRVSKLQGSVYMYTREGGFFDS